MTNQFEGVAYLCGIIVIYFVYGVSPTLDLIFYWQSYARFVQSRHVRM